METFKHRHPIQVRFNDVDQMGHINNAVIMEYFDLGKSRYFQDSHVPVRPEEGDFTVMIVHYEVDFIGQLHADDAIEVCTKLEKIGNKSLTILQHIQVNGIPKVVCHTVMAGYSRSQAASAVIPEEVKSSLIAFES